MPLPGFTAEASIGPTTQVYRVHDRYGTTALSGLYPQFDGEVEDMDLGWEEGIDDETAMAMEDDLDNGTAMDMMAEDDIGAVDDLESIENIEGVEDV